MDFWKILLNVCNPLGFIPFFKSYVLLFFNCLLNACIIFVPFYFFSKSLESFSIILSKILLLLYWLTFNLKGTFLSISLSEFISKYSKNYFRKINKLLIFKYCSPWLFEVSTWWWRTNQILLSLIHRYQQLYYLEFYILSILRFPISLEIILKQEKDLPVPPLRSIHSHSSQGN